jgi:hypothetical protein
MDNRVGLDKLGDHLLFDGQIAEEFGRLDHLLARVDE